MPQSREKFVVEAIKGRGAIRIPGAPGHPLKKNLRTGTDKGAGSSCTLETEWDGKSLCPDLDDWEGAPSLQAAS